GQRAAIHRVAHAVRHEPRGLVADAEVTVKLMRADALLARRHQVQAEQPLRERNPRILEHGADRHGELFTARTALVEALTSRLLARGLRSQLVGVSAAAVRASSAVRPAPLLDQLAGGVLIAEVLREGRNVDLHGL